MNSIFWARAHGGLTHFPIALVFAAAFFDTVSIFRGRFANKYDFNAIGYWLVIFGAIGSFGAVFSGLALSKWSFGGTGLIRRHHLFVWPAFVLIVGLATWRLLVGSKPGPRALIIYAAILLGCCALIGAAGFFGGEILLGN